MVPCGKRDRSLRPYSRLSRPEPLHFLSSSSSEPFLTAYKTVTPRANILIKKKTPWSESANELYRPSDRRLSAGLERGSLSLVSTTEELLDRKVGSPV
jgi:hypothetical protein